MVKTLLLINIFISNIETSNEDMSITSSHELIKVSAFLENPRIVTSVKCQEVTMSGYVHDWWV